MAKKRTKKQKIKAKKNLANKSKSTGANSAPASSKDPVIKSKITSTTQPDQVATQTNHLLAFPVKFIYQDLAKTALVTIIILAILIALAIYY